MKNLTATLLLATAVLTLGTVKPALAADYSSTLAFDSNTVNATLDVYGTPVPITVGIDLDRYDLGNALGGSATNVTFTTHNAFDPAATMLAVAFTTDPNEALFNDPASLAGFINPTTDVTTFFNEHVIGWQYYVYGNRLVPNGTSDISGMFPASKPMTFNLGTNYYAFVTGGSVFKSGAPTDASIGYTLSVAAVPEPETWGMMVAGLGILGLFYRRRGRTPIA